MTPALSQQERLVTTAQPCRPMDFLPNQNFTCEGCTKCCRGWRILVDSHSRERLPQAGLEVRESRCYTRKKPDGRCYFLSDEGLCQVHPQKPLGCRQFPFRLCRTPSGVSVGVSFYCSAVQRNHGRALAEAAGELEEMARDLPLIGAEGVVLLGDRKCSWQEYLQLEEFLLEHLHEPQEALGRALWAVAQGLHGRGGRLSEWLLASQEALAPPNEPLAWLERPLAFVLLAHAEGLDRDALRGNRPIRWRAFQGRPVDLPRAPHPEMLERYLKALLWRKFLVLRRPLWHNLAALFLLPRLWELWAGVAGVEAALDGCEYRLYTHGGSVDGPFAEVGEELLWALK